MQLANASFVVSTTYDGRTISVFLIRILHVVGLLVIQHQKVSYSSSSTTMGRLPLSAAGGGKGPLGQWYF